MAEAALLWAGAPSPGCPACTRAHGHRVPACRPGSEQGVGSHLGSVSQRCWPLPELQGQGAADPTLRGCSPLRGGWRLDEGGASGGLGWEDTWQQQPERKV